METKICTKCEAEKPINEFSWRNKSLNKRASYCKECVSNADSNSYQNDTKKRKRLRARAMKQYHFLKEFVRRYKMLLKCSKCGDKRWYVLDFHHIKDKDNNVSLMAKQGVSIDTLKKEIRKCVPLCANCHREKHFLERCE